MHARVTVAFAILVAAGWVVTALAAGGAWWQWAYAVAWLAIGGFLLRRHRLTHDAPSPRETGDKLRVRMASWTAWTRRTNVPPASRP